MGNITYQDAKNRSLEELKEMCRSNPSALVRIFGDSVSELGSLEGRGFVNRLRQNDFDLGYADISQVHGLSMGGLDHYFKQKYPDHKIWTKGMHLPSLIFYEKLLSHHVM